MDRHRRDILRLCCAEGVEVKGLKVTGGGHLRAETDVGFIYFPNTPSDQRWVKNARAQLRNTTQRSVH